MTEVLKTVESVRQFHEKIESKKLALVPTMGNLHDGHLSLINIAQKNADFVVVSIFVNPTQFAPDEDLEAYPRTFEADLAKLQSVGVDAVFYPNDEAIYPFGIEEALSIDMPQHMVKILCGVNRPTHFQGVATVVAKLFQIVQPDIAVFGEKDFQQLAIIRRLARELFMNIRILGGSIMREASGLAMSSRNQYLDDEARERAAWLSNTLQNCRERVLKGDAVDTVIAEGKATLAEHDIKVDYLDFRDVDTLQETPEIDNGIFLVAAHVGQTRLIDNLRVL